jgi:hypothetical protein
MIYRIESRWSTRFVEATAVEGAIRKYRRQCLREWTEDRDRARKPPPRVRRDMEPVRVERVSEDNAVR